MGYFSVVSEIHMTKMYNVSTCKTNELKSVLKKTPNKQGKNPKQNCKTTTNFLDPASL